MTVDLSTAWWDLLPFVPPSVGALQRYDIDGVTWVSDGYIGFVESPCARHEGGEKGVEGIRAMLAWERRQLVLTGEVENDRWRAVSVAYDGDRPVHIPCGELARLVDACDAMWTPCEFEDSEPVPLAWMLAVNPQDYGASAVVIVSASGPVAFIMPLRPREES